MHTSVFFGASAYSESVGAVFDLSGLIGTERWYMNVL
jgi:hypothetical protein